MEIQVHGNNNGRYVPNQNNNRNNNGNGTGNNKQYIYNGKVLTGDPNNNSTNIFNSTNLRGADPNDPLRRIGLQTENERNNSNSSSIPKVEKDLPKTGESNSKVVIGIFAVTILIGIMYIYGGKLKKINRKSRRR